MKRKPSRMDDGEGDSDDDAPAHAPGSTAELVANVLAQDARSKKKSSDARATVLPSGNDSDDDKPRANSDKSSGKKVAFADIDDDEEDLALKAEGAAKKRALLRSEMAANMRDADDVDARESVEQAEEAVTGDVSDDGEKFEPFNLEQERKEGYFDDDGNYVEYAEEKDETDLWLEKDAKVDERFATGAIKRSTAILEEEENAQAMSSREIADMQRDIAAYLKPGETVLGALKRLGGGKTDNRKGRGAPQKPPKVMSGEEKKAFDTLTELSSALMSNGEYEVYTFQKEAFERAAALYAPPVITNDAGTKDMFADSDDDEVDVSAPAIEPKSKKAKVEEPAKASGIDFSSMNVSKLKCYIKSHGGSVEGNIAEKRELVERAQACAPAPVPEGYVYDAENDMYFCEASNLWYSHVKRLFTDRFKWWYYDTAKGFVECAPE